MDQIKIEPINETKEAFDVHDILRSDKSQDLDPRKVSMLFKKIIVSLNQVIREIEGLKK